MKQKEIVTNTFNRKTTYDTAVQHIKNKDIAINDYIDSMLNKTFKMFKYEGLPETITARNLEQWLQYDGECIIAKDNNGDLYALTGSKGGELNAYFEYTGYTVANPYLNLFKTFTIDKDCVLIRNDSHSLGLYPIFAKYGALLVDCHITMNSLIVLSRVLYLISASDDKTRESANIFLDKVLKGDFSVIGDSPFFDGVKLQTNNAQNNIFSQIVEMTQYIKASAFNEIGLNANFNMKRERLNSAETELNTDALKPLIDDMLECRQEAIEKINKMYGTNISVMLSSEWAVKPNTNIEENPQETENEPTEKTEPVDPVETENEPTENDKEKTEPVETDKEKTEPVDDKEKKEDK